MKKRCRYNSLKLLPKAKRLFETAESRIKFEYALLAETFKGAVVRDNKHDVLVPSLRWFRYDCGFTMKYSVGRGKRSIVGKFSYMVFCVLVLSA